MAGLMQAMVAGLSAAIFAVMGKLFTQSFFEAVISKVVIYLLSKLVDMESNTIGADLVKDAADRLGVDYGGS